MTQTGISVSNNHSASPAARLAWILLVLATLYLCYFHNLGVVGFIGPDEPRYAWIAREMAERGDWVTPRLYGKPWFEKPVLYYWGAALSFKLFGVSEAAARFPSALAALFATLAMAWLAWRVYGRDTARWLLLLLPTTVGMIGFSHAAATDMPFAGMLTIAMVFAARLIGLVPVSSATSFMSSVSFTSSFFGFFLGLAVLAKGPAAIILSGGAVLLWAAITKRWRDGFRCLHPVALASFCLTALPWYILCARHNPDFFHVFIVEHNFKRYLTPQFQHIQPFWFYVPVLCVCFIPWLFLLGYAVYMGLHNLPFVMSQKPSTLFLVSWSTFCFIFFSISESKLPGYMLPAVPAIGLLLSRQCCQPARQPRAISFLALLFAVLLFIVGVITYWRSAASTMYRIAAGRLATPILFLTVAASLLLALAYSSWDSPLQRSLYRFLAVAVLLCALVVWPNYLTRAERGLISPKALAEGLLKYKFPLDRVFVWKSANRSWRFGASFYLHSEIADWNPDIHQQAFVITGGTPCSRVQTLGYDWTEIPMVDSNGLWFVCRFDPVHSVSGLDTLGRSGAQRADGQPR